MDIRIERSDGLEFLQTVADNSVDLILTDPPYNTSRKSGMDEFHKRIHSSEGNGKTEEEWNAFKVSLDKPQAELDADEGPGWSKSNYMRYGSILGKKYGVVTDYGEWDRDFGIAELEPFIEHFYAKLKRGGTVIIWYDLWKIGQLKTLLEKYRFKQLRMIEWIKTNPQPLNSKRNYLTNCREVALTAVKGTRPVFHSTYDIGVYEYPMAAGKHKFHPTQKNAQLFQALVEKHSNEGDLVLDPFLGSGTTAVACQRSRRSFTGCDLSEDYVARSLVRLADIDN